MARVPWQEAAPHEFIRLRDEVQQTFPELRVFERRRLVHVAGLFRIFFQGTQVVRRHIDVVLPPNYPHEIPIVLETKGDIPRNIDNHTGPNGELCLFAPGERHLHWPKGSSFSDFLAGPVQAFFVGYSSFIETGLWPFGQRAHNRAGIIQSYAEMLGTENEEKIEEYLRMLSSKEVKGHWPCPCLCGKTIRDCHKKEIQVLRRNINFVEARHAYGIFLNPNEKGIENASNSSASIEVK